jgi:hypothetical protein
MSGTVNFISPIAPVTASAPGGGTSFFSLETALSDASACKAALDNSVPKPPGGGTQITAAFTPQGGYNLAQAATICGFVEFDWQSTITSWPAPSGLFSACSATPLTAGPPPLTSFNDPPACGYKYQNPPNAVQLPVYYNLFITGNWWSLGNVANTNAGGPNLPSKMSQQMPVYLVHRACQ